jgi:hypothetical protein
VSASRQGPPTWFARVRAAWDRLIEQQTREDRRLWRALMICVAMIAFAVVVRW